LSKPRGGLEAAGAGFSNVVHMKVIFRDVPDFKQFNEVFRREIGEDQAKRTRISGTR
jgi:enamine deaminase RidA (YjgF/YER057c/UK114 family)